MIEPLKAIFGRPEDSDRIAWLSYAADLKCAFLLLVYVPGMVDQTTPVVLWKRHELFDKLNSLQWGHTLLTIEIYNPNLDHRIQLDKPLVLDERPYPNLAPKLYDDKLFHKAIPMFTDTSGIKRFISQFDIELWFDFGKTIGVDYMILAINPLVYEQFYPVYSDQKGLLNRIMNTKLGYTNGAVAIYDLNSNFEYQYMNGMYSAIEKPNKFYSVREEVLPVFADDEEVEGFRRRLFDFFCYSQVCGPENDLCIGSALELLVYGKKLEVSKRDYAVLLLLHAVSSIQKEGSGCWRVLPYSLLLTHYTRSIESRAETSVFCNPDHYSRYFGMACCSLFSIKLADITKTFSYYYSKGYEIKGLLYLLWHASGTKNMKLQFIQEQLKVDGKQANSAYKPPSPSPDMVKDLYLALKPHTLPNPFTDFYTRYFEHKKQAYHKETSLLYALHTDPTPRLQFERERKLCEARAEAGDINSIILLSAYFFWCEGNYGDYPKALYWIKKGVKKNHPTAICLLGWAYFDERGMKQNTEKGIELLTRATDMGYATAYYYLSKCYEYGKNSIRNDIKAYAYLLICRWTLEDYPDFNEVEQRIDSYSSKLNRREIKEASQFAEIIRKNIVFLPSEPAEYMGEVCQKELFNDRMCWNWGLNKHSTSSLPITQL